MDSQDLRTFAAWFDVLAVTHRLNSTEDQRGKMQAEYFDVLRPYPLEAVRFSYESLRRKMKKWPVPADWLEALPPFGSTSRLPLLTAEEIAENDHAEKLGYEADRVCHCDDCAAADCFMAPHYVPRLDYRGEIQERRHPQRDGRPVLLGRWIHGHELKRWYAARANFYSLKAKVFAALQAERGMDPQSRMDRLTNEVRVLTAK